MDRHKLQMRIMDLHNDVVDTVGFAGYDEHGVGEAACRRLALKGHESAAARFSAESVYETLISIYEKLL